MSGKEELIGLLNSFKDMLEVTIAKKRAEEAKNNAWNVHEEDMEESPDEEAQKNMLFKYGRKLVPHIDKVIHKFLEKNGGIKNRDIAALLFFGTILYVHAIDSNDLPKDMLLSYKESILKRLGCLFTRAGEEYYADFKPKGCDHEQ
jgi:hypothetical protein